MRADELLVETIEGLFDNEVTPERVSAAEGSYDRKLWALLEDSGLTFVGVPEDDGGSGGTLADLAAIARSAGRHAAPVPVADTLIAHLLLRGYTLPSGPLAIAVLDEPGASIARVPWGGVAEHIVSVGAQGIALHRTAGFAADDVVERGVNYAGEPWIGIAAAALRVGAVHRDTTPHQGLAAAALGRAMLMAGALERVVELSIRHANEREQFGRPIARFQVLQHYLVEMAGESATAAAALDNAIDVTDASPDRTEHVLAIGAAKALAGRAVGPVNRLAHQIHGAIGFTEEHQLQLFTRRLWAWRDEFGTDSQWAARLGRAVASAGGDALWSRVTSWPPVV